MPKLQFICVKWGDKYPADYVNRLRSMIARFTKSPFVLHCVTENAEGIHPDVKILPLVDASLSGWWHKLSLFKADFYGLSGPMIFMDLDVVITDDLTPLFEYKPGKFAIIHDLLTKGYNSSVFRYEVGAYGHVWENFQKDAENITARLNGDQDWITEQIVDAELWPSEWVVSFKKQCHARMSNTLGITGSLFRKFGLLQPKGEAVLPEGAKIVQFHGKPDPEDVMNGPYGIYKAAPWIKDYWRL